MQSDKSPRFLRSLLPFHLVFDFTKYIPPVYNTDRRYKSNQFFFLALMIKKINHSLRYRFGRRGAFVGTYILPLSIFGPGECKHTFQRGWGSLAMFICAPSTPVGSVRITVDSLSNMTS